MAVVVFIAGFVSGRYLQFSNWKLHITRSSADQPQQGPIYDYVQPSTMKGQDDLELKVNMSYQPTKSITVEK